MTKANTTSYSSRQSKRERIKHAKKENRDKERKALRKKKNDVAPPKEKQTTIPTSAAGIKLPKLPGGKPGGRGSRSAYRRSKASGKMRGHKAPGKSGKSKRSGDR